MTEETEKKEKPMAQPTSDPGTINAFGHLLQSMEGDLHHDLTDAIITIVAALNEAREDGAAKPKASMTIKLGFALDGGTIDITGDFSTKYPVKKRERSVFWTTPGNRLTASNPKQQSLPFKEIAASPTAVKAI